MNSKFNNEERLVIISPGYNCSKFIELWYNSIRVQNYKNWICLAIDDISTDDTYDKLVEISRIDSRIIPLKSTVKHYQLRNWYLCIHNDFKEFDCPDMTKLPFISNNDIIIFHDMDDWFGTKYAFEYTVKEFRSREVHCLTARNFQLSDYYNHDGELYTDRSQLDISYHAFSLFAYRAWLFRGIPEEHFIDPSTGEFYQVCGDMAITQPILYQAGPEHHQHLFIDNLIIYNNVRLECDDNKVLETGESAHKVAQKSLYESFLKLKSENKFRCILSIKTHTF